MRKNSFVFRDAREVIPYKKILILLVGATIGRPLFVHDNRSFSGCRGRHPLPQNCMIRRRGDHWSPAFCAQFAFVSGGEPPSPTDFIIYLCRGGVPPPAFVHDRRLFLRRHQGTALHIASKQLSYFVGSRWSLQNRGSKNEVLPRVDCLSVY